MSGFWTLTVKLFNINWSSLVTMVCHFVTTIQNLEGLSNGRPAQNHD
jgi:hypothetical protein